MKVLIKIPERALRGGAVVAAIGIFDGVHRGHRAILRQAVRRAKKIGGVPVAVTFYPHPTVVLAPQAVPPMLLSLDQRLCAFQTCGIRAAVVVPFTRSFSKWTAEEFARRFLTGRLRVKEVVVGHDFGFGAGRSGTVETLRLLGARFGFQVRVVTPIRLEGMRISSRSIREMVRSGRLARAARFLGRPVSLTGRVVRGDGRGRVLGFPTANIQTASGVLPPVGVYAVRGRVGKGPLLKGMANLGYRPTFRRRVKSEKPVLEVHFFGFKKRLIGRDLELEFVGKLRPERKFASAELLKVQLKRDAARARRLL